ncbi:MAG: hypothetical protein ACI3ZP_06430 [Candidatus Cryptobacteroides sp.]
MAKTHITLVGGQPIPIYNGIRYAEPDNVVFIYSSQSKAIVDRIREFVCCGIIEQEPLDTTDPKAIQNLAERLYSQFRDDEITLNISGGLKSWSHIFGVTFHNKPGTTVFYIDQNNTVLDFKEMKTFKPDFDSLSISEYLTLYGQDLARSRRLSEYTEEDFEAISEIRKARKINYEAFKQLTIELNEKEKEIIKKPSGIIVRKYNHASWGSETEIEICINNRYGRTYHFDIVGPHARDLVFHSSWFEIYVAGIISKWGHSREVRTNCIFRYGGGSPKNEIDIIVNLGNKLLFVECKTQIFNNIDLDKFISVVKTMSGTASKAVFITESPMKPDTVEKCEENGIIHFSFAGGSGKDLYKLLDKEYDKLNK